MAEIVKMVNMTVLSNELPFTSWINGNNIWGYRATAVLFGMQAANLWNEPEVYQSAVAPHSSNSKVGSGV